MDEWKWQQENARLRKKLASCVATLDYYSDKDNYKLSGFRGARRLAKIETDSGEKARRVLEELANEFSENV